MTDPWIGTQIGEYHVDDLLGEGGMGKVYTATGPDGTRVALKLVKGDFARDETFRRRFSREARIAQTVKHPNVVPVVSTGEHEGHPYMAQRFIEGRSLDERLKQDGTLDVATTIQISSDVAAGLEALWAAGMVHRDVKPANILLDGDGKAYITDFGLAKDTQGSMLTLPGQALGSMDYMAPEQIRGEAVTAATDIYALGCCRVRVALRAAAVRRRPGHACALGPPAGSPARPQRAAQRPDAGGQAGAADRHGEGRRQASSQRRRVRPAARQRGRRDPVARLSQFSATARRTACARREVP